jgi:hypothetical protein
MLLMKPNCECCDRDLPADGADALVCSFECTFCRDCGADRFGGRCPNCNGALTARPTRAKDLWSRFPPSAQRFTKVHPPCVATKAA